jgi:hypothetical protein
MTDLEPGERAGDRTARGQQADLGPGVRWYEMQDDEGSWVVIEMEV